MLHGSETWCLKQGEMVILRRTERAMCEVLLRDRKGSTELMLMLGLNETIDQLAMANCVHWDGDVLR